MNFKNQKILTIKLVMLLRQKETNLSNLLEIKVVINRIGNYAVQHNYMVLVI